MGQLISFLVIKCVYSECLYLFKFSLKFNNVVVHSVILVPTSYLVSILVGDRVGSRFK